MKMLCTSGRRKSSRPAAAAVALPRTRVLLLSGVLFVASSRTGRAFLEQDRSRREDEDPHQHHQNLREITPAAEQQAGAGSVLLQQAPQESAGAIIPHEVLPQQPLSPARPAAKSVLGHSSSLSVLEVGGTSKAAASASSTTSSSSTKSQSTRTYGFDMESLRMSVLRIKTIAPAFDFLSPQLTGEPEVALGSGFVVRTMRTVDGKEEFDPVIITNAHVVSNAEEVQLQLLALSDQPFEAVTKQICGQLDVAVLKFKDPAKFKKALGDVSPPLELLPLKFAEKTPSMGEKVLAIGFPLGQNLPKISGGEVSGNQEVDGNICIQSTAPISPGNSGGPLLLEEKKEVVGINFAKATGGAENVNYVIPFWRVQHMLGLYDHNESLSMLEKARAESSTGEDSSNSGDSSTPGEQDGGSGGGETLLQVQQRVKVARATSQNTHRQIRIPQLDVRVAMGSDAIYDLDTKCKDHEGILLTQIEDRSLLRSANPPAQVGSYLFKVGESSVDRFGKGRINSFLQDQMSYENLFFMQGDKANCESCGTECSQCDALFRDVKFFTCSDGDTTEHTLPLQWQEKYDSGVKTIEEPTFQRDDIEYVPFGDVSVMQMTTNLISALLNGGAGMPTISRWLLPREIVHERLAVNWVGSGTEAADTLTAGMVIRRLNGCNVNSMEEFRTFFLPRVARETDCGTKSESTLLLAESGHGEDGRKEYTATDTTSEGRDDENSMASFLQKSRARAARQEALAESGLSRTRSTLSSHELYAQEQSSVNATTSEAIMDNIWSVETDLGVFYAVRFKETLAKAMNAYCESPMLSYLDDTLVEASTLTDFADDEVSPECRKQVENLGKAGGDSSLGQMSRRRSLKSRRGRGYDFLIEKMRSEVVAKQQARDDSGAQHHPSSARNKLLRAAADLMAQADALKAQAQQADEEADDIGQAAAVAAAVGNLGQNMQSGVDGADASLHEKQKQGRDAPAQHPTPPPGPASSDSKKAPPPSTSSGATAAPPAKTDDKLSSKSPDSPPAAGAATSPPAASGAANSVVASAGAQSFVQQKTNAMDAVFSPISAMVHQVFGGSKVQQVAQKASSVADIPANGHRVKAGPLLVSKDELGNYRTTTLAIFA